MNLVRGMHGHGERSTARVEAFSDGVIAIAITLLVLDVHVPRADQTEPSHLWHALGDLWPNYVGYLLSFSVIGIMWANHHDIFEHIGRVDRALVLLNTLFLLALSFIPFPTSLLAEYLGRDGERTATIVYTGWFFFTAVTYNLLWRYASKPEMLDENADLAVVATITKRFNMGPPAYLLAFLVSFVSPTAALGISAALALLYILPVALHRD
jgi:uncharacterized membrane protein